MKWLVMLFVIWVIAVSIYESSQKAELSKLSLQIKEMAEGFDALKYDGTAVFDETMPRNVQIKQLQRQADMLRFCFLCPLYQEKVLKDKQQTLL